MNENQGNKTLLVVLAVVILAAVAFVWYYTWDGNNNEDTDLSTDDNNVVNNPDNEEPAVEEYSASDFGDMSVSFEYPTAAEVDMPNDDAVRIRYVGPESELNSEITDGYIITIQNVEADSLEDYATDAEGRLDVVSSTNFNGYDALEYQVETQLGTTVTHTVFEVEGSDRIVDISVGAFGDRAQAYRSAIGNILDSLEFEAEAEVS